MTSKKTMFGLMRAGLAACSLLLASGAVQAQSAVTLTAAPTTANLPDGQSVPMWGYICGDSLATPVASTNATCTSMNGVGQTGKSWQPPLIRVQAGTSGFASLTITLNNQLSFAGVAVPTSIVIDGQAGGGLGDSSARMPSPAHAPYGTTWPGTLGTTGPNDPVFTPPDQGQGRVRSFATEVAVGATTNNALTWNKMRPGTYLIHSGTEPSIQHPMGLYGVLVVTETTATSAYGTAYDADVPLLFSEIDPVQNNAVTAAVGTTGFSETDTWVGPGAACKNGAAACYPPAVNYSPRYYLINGTSFDRTNVTGSTLVVPAPGVSGNVLLRIVNAGQRMHAPAVVGANMTLLAEDGNKVSGGTRIQASVPMPPGKTFDVAIKPTQIAAGIYDAATLPVYDRQLSLSTNNQRDGGMQAYIALNGGAPSGAGSAASAVVLSAADKTYYCVAGTTLSITDVSKGVLGGAVGASGASLGVVSLGAGDNLAFNPDGTFTYAPAAGTVCGGSFAYNVNGTQAHTATIAQCDANSSAASGCKLAAVPVANAVTFNSNVASRYASPPPGLIASVTNLSGLTLKVNAPTNVVGGTVTLNADGSFVTTRSCTAPCSVTFAYSVSNAQNVSSNSAPVTVNFPTGSGLAVAVKDGPTGLPVSDYRWIIEEDRTFWVDPKCQVNSADPLVRPSTCPPLPVESLGYNFHSAQMPVVAQGCVGTVSCEAGQKLQGQDAVCDVGNGACRTGATQKTPVNLADVHLDPNKRYFVSILPGDGINPTISGYTGTPQGCGAYTGATGQWALYDPASGSAGNCGHEMGGTQVAPGATAIAINLQQTPLPSAKIAVFVFEDDNPVNGENDAGGGVDVIAPNEPGLGGFEIKLFDQAGQLGDNTGQITYDMFNQPVSNSLAGFIDPLTNLDACPITARKDGVVGMVPTCPKFEADGKTPSPLAGQAVIANLYPGLYEIQAYPAADRIAKGEQWLQTNTLDGGKPHEAFIKPNEPGYFQEFGPGGFHVSIGFANPKIINDRKAGYCASTLNAGGAASCNNTLTVEVTNNHMSRTPDQRTYDSESYDHYNFTQCYVSVGPADAEDFAFQPCVLTAGTDGKTHATATFTGMPAGTFKMTVFDQWNDIMLDGLVGTVEIGAGTTVKKFPVTQWRTNLYTRTFIDDPKAANPGVSDDSKPGLALVNINIRYRDGSVAFFNNTDLNGYAAWNEVFPFMNWLVVETTQTRYKPTWVHSVYDAGGPVDGSTGSTMTSTIAANLANTDARVPLPTDLRFPGAKYCDSADCPANDGFNGKSSGALFPGQGFFSNTMGWQGLLGQNTFMEFGVKPFKKADPVALAPAENGGIHGMVVYASTRPFDDPSLLLQLSWEPGVPNATINLYNKTTDALGNEVLKLVDTTQSASWDDWAQGFRKDGNGNLLKAADGNYIPNMNCPGQDATSPFFATLKNSKEYLDPDRKPLAYNSQFKCYDGWSQLNQAQPAPYDGFYKFPSVTAIDPKTGKPAKSNCTGCTVNPDDGTPMLPAGKYVVEVVMPPGYELVKEEDKNILMGDVMVAPVSQQFAGFGNVFIRPDQAAVNSVYNAANPGGLNKTVDLGSKTFPRHEGDTGSIETYWPCVGALRQVPDFNSEFPGAGQAAPFAGAMRHLCDRKEITLSDESSALAKFYLFSSTHIAGHFTGTITNDFASEFDPFSPQFGEKFGPPNLPVGIRDFNGNEVARVYSDQWGIYNGLYFSSWSVNPPNPTGYAPQMSIACMNDPGPILDTRTGSPTLGQMITDPSYNPAYSNFCYEQPFMPGTTTYMDTPVIPTQAFADGYNLPDTEYPDGTPAIKTVVNSSTTISIPGPWVEAATTAANATASFTISGVNRCQSGNCNNRTTLTFPIGTVQCMSNDTGGPNCNDSASDTRNTNVAAYIRSHIVALMGTGYTASGRGPNVTVTAPAVGSSYNGTFVVNATSGLGTPTAPVQLTNGADASTASATGITITALGDKAVQNPNFAGPNATTAPYNQKTIVRHYGFGAAGTASLVAPDGSTTANLAINSWADATISATVPSLSAAFNCSVQQIGAPVTKCGQLVITRADNGKRSIDAITVTVGGSAPWIATPTGVTPPTGKTVHDYAAAFGRMNLSGNGNGSVTSPIQVAIDSAGPGDLILVAPGNYHENLIMWKPVRLQGVGAASVTINADAHPAGHMDQWRRQMVCVFGLTLQGVPNLGNQQGAFDPSGQYSCPDAMFITGDRIPFEAITGWQASGNGNLAQVLQEPTLLGAYEGAGITTVGRGVRAPAGDPFFLGNDPAAAGGFPNGSRYLTDSNTDCTISTGTAALNGGNYGTSNYRCNPSRVDGLSVLNSSQGGGGLFIHGWAHNLEVANNRISSNHGTLAGAINLGNGETPPVFLNDGTTCGTGVAATAPLCPPIPGGTPTGAAIPFGFNTFVRIHHNMLYNNASIGDALFTGTPAGAGGVTVSAGGDNYQIDHNWIAGNLTTGDGGGIQTLGVTFNGKINNNVILFNQSTNPTLPTNGGGIVIQGANEPRTFQGTECGGATDHDCPPGLGDGTGAGLVIDGNLIYGNSAESGTGGGIALEQINGSEVIAFPTAPANWYGITLINNIIANNVAGYDGGGVSMRDALKLSFINNTIVSNDTTASAGVLFKTLGAINSSSPPPGCNAVTDPTAPQSPSCLGRDAPHGPQPSGLVTMAHTQNLNDAIAGIVVTGTGPRLTCPDGYGYAVNGALGLTNGDCMKFSRPALVNDLFWQNRSFHVNISSRGTGLQSQQNLVVIAPGLATNSTPLSSQTATGQCPTGASYWDIGLRTDNVDAGLLCHPGVGVIGCAGNGNSLVVTNSILTGTGDIGTAEETVASATNKVGVANPVVAQVCNGARVPPEYCAVGAVNGQNGAASCTGFNAPPGASESTSTSPLFVFKGIQPTATVDEGHNWLNLIYGPLTLNRTAVGQASSPPELMIASAATGTAGGAYSIPATSVAVNGGSNSVAPATDFFGNLRPRTTANPADIGAVECQGSACSGSIPAPIASVTGGPLAFGNVATGTTSPSRQLVLQNSGNASLTGIILAFSSPSYSRPAGTVGGTCTTTLAQASTCTINVVLSPNALGLVNATLTITANATVTGSPVSLSGTGVAPPTLPALGVLDTFSRANANTLGTSSSGTAWSQVTLLGAAAIHVASNQALCSGLGCALGGYAYLGNGTTSGVYGSRQGAGVTFTTAPQNNSALLLKVTGGSATVGANGVRVRYNGGTIFVETTTNSGFSYTQASSFAATLAAGQTLGATVDGTGLVNVWGNGVFVGSAQLPNVALWTTGGGRIGLLVPSGTSTMDNFVGGNF